MIDHDRLDVIRMSPLPDTVARSFAKRERDPDAYLTMNGPGECPRVIRWTALAGGRTRALRRQRRCSR